MSAADIPVYDGRIIGTKGSELKRALTAPLRMEGEFHSTQQDRAFCRDVMIGPQVDHGDIGSEAAMLSLNTTSALSQYGVPVGCWPKDTCRLTYTVPISLMRCKSNHGETLADWERIGFDAEGTALAGHWEPVVEGDEVLFDGDEDDDDGDLIMDFVDESED